MLPLPLTCGQVLLARFWRSGYARQSCERAHRVRWAAIRFSSVSWIGFKLLLVSESVEMVYRAMIASSARDRLQHRIHPGSICGSTSGYNHLQLSAAWLRTPVPFGETTPAPGQDPLLVRYHLPGPRLRANESAFWKAHAINCLKESENSRHPCCCSLTQSIAYRETAQRASAKFCGGMQLWCDFVRKTVGCSKTPCSEQLFVSVPLQWPVTGLPELPGRSPNPLGDRTRSLSRPAAPLTGTCSWRAVRVFLTRYVPRLVASDKAIWRPKRRSLETRCFRGFGPTACFAFSR
jgi:hypothetical protein